jgi:hypothetical protein
MPDDQPCDCSADLNGQTDGKTTLFPHGGLPGSAVPPSLKSIGNSNIAFSLHSEKPVGLQQWLLGIIKHKYKTSRFTIDASP